MSTAIEITEVSTAILHEPFVGVRPYTRAQADVFFERREDARTLLETLLTRRLVLLYGESGNGKSSLINAGLVPMLERARFKESLQPEVLRIHEDFAGLTVDRRPLSSGAENAGSTFHSLFRDGSDASGSGNSDTFTLPVDEMIRQLRDYITAQPGRRVLLMIDQFEELYTYGGGRSAFSVSRNRSAETGGRLKAQEKLARQLGELLRARLTSEPGNDAVDEDGELPVKFLFVFREEYLVKLQALVPDLLTAAPVRLPIIPTDRLASVIEGPFLLPDTETKRTAAPFANHELAEFYRKNAAPLRYGFEVRVGGIGQNVLTELQIVCTELWSQAKGRATVRVAAKAGDPMRMADVIDEIITHHFQRALGEFGDAKPTALDVLCEMVTSDKTRNIASEPSLRDKLATREGLDPEELKCRHPWEIIESVLKQLGRQRFINRAERNGTVFYDITSESLIPWLGAERKTRVDAFERTRIEREENVRMERIEQLKKEEQIRTEAAKKLRQVIAILLVIGLTAGLIIIFALSKVSTLREEQGNLMAQSDQLRTELKRADEDRHAEELRAKEQDKENREVIAEQDTKNRKLAGKIEEQEATNQELIAKNKAQEARNQELTAQNGPLMDQNAKIKTALSELQQEIVELNTVVHDVRAEVGRVPLMEKQSKNLLAALDRVQKTANTSASQFENATNAISTVSVIIDTLDWRTGKAQIWGGAGGSGGFGNTLAFIQTWQQAEATGVFRPDANRSKPPNAEGFDPAKYYIAARWDYTKTPSDWLIHNKVRVRNPKNPKVEFEAQPVEWGPPDKNGELMAISPGLAKALGVERHDDVSYFYPDKQIESAPDPKSPPKTILTPISKGTLVVMLSIKDHATKAVAAIPSLYVWIGKIDHKNQRTVEYRVFKSQIVPKNRYSDAEVDSKLRALPGAGILKSGFIGIGEPRVFTYGSKNYELDVTEIHSGWKQDDQVVLKVIEK